MNWAEFWPGATEFALKVGVPALLGGAAIIYGFGALKELFRMLAEKYRSGDD